MAMLQGVTNDKVSCGMLVKFDRSKCQQALNKVEKKIEEVQIRVSGKKVFRFRRGAERKKNAAFEKLKKAEVQADEPLKQKSGDSTTADEGAPREKASLRSSMREKAGDMENSSITLKNKTGELIVLKDELATDDKGLRDIALKDLTDCDIYIMGEVGALHMHGLKGCSVFAPCVRGSSLMYELNDCVLCLALRQLRLHESNLLCIYLHAESDPVIERCSKILFSSAVGMLNFPENMQLWQKDGFSTNANWTNVKDFYWHKRQHSPNWHEMADGNRRPAVTAVAGERLARPELADGVWEAAVQAFEASQAAESDDEI